MKIFLKNKSCFFFYTLFIVHASFFFSTFAFCEELIQGDKVETVPGVPICETYALMSEFDKKIKSNSSVQEYLSLLRSGCFIGDSKSFGMFVQKQNGIYEFKLDNGKKLYTIQKGIKYRDIDLVMLERVFENRFDENYVVEEKDTYERKYEKTVVQKSQPKGQDTSNSKLTYSKRYRSEDEMVKYHVDNLAELRRRQREFLRRESGIYDFEDIRTAQSSKKQISESTKSQQQTTGAPASSKFRMKMSKDQLLGLLVFGGEDKKVDGECRVVLIDGSVLSGQFTNGILNGKGEILFNNGVRLIGEFKDGILNGYGEYIGSNVIMKGNFENGLLTGLGNVYIRQRKEVVSGEFRNGKLDGIGKICRVGYKCLIGSFSNGVFESTAMN